MNCKYFKGNCKHATGYTVLRCRDCNDQYKLDGKGFKLCDESQCRYKPAKTTVLATPTDKRYFKLHNGDILDTENKMILSGEVLKRLLND